jgi:hypothetical protein
LSVVIAAAAGIGGPYLGSHATLESSRQQADVTLEINHQQIEQARTAADKAKRVGVYSDYLKAATAYRDQAERVALAIKVQRDSHQPYSTLLAAIARFTDAQFQVNQVAVYGTPEIWNAHKIVASSLPLTLGVVDIARPKPRTFERGYRTFVGVFCEQETPTANQACKDVRTIGSPG